jgi:hypothetical protein
MTTHPNEQRGRSQAAKILDYIRAHGAITPIDALIEIGCFRLGARIYDLKQDGHRIETRLVEVRTRTGGTARVAEYYLERSKPAPTEQQGLAL